MTKTILILILTVASTFSLVAQAHSEMTYRLRAKLPINIVYKYKFSEIQTVTTYLKSGDEWEEMTYDRKADIYFSTRASDKRTDGFTEVDLKVDSINYSLVSGDKSINYRSDDISAFPPINSKDYLRYGLSTEVDYDLLYSPYSEVSQVISPQLVEKRKLFTGKGVTDKLTRDLLTNYLSDRMIAFIYDPIKNVLPDKDIELEEVWSPSIDLEMGGYWWNSKPEFKITSYDRTGFLLESTLDSVSMPATDIFFQDLTLEGKMTESTVSGVMNAFLTTQGVSESAVVNLDVEHSGDIGGRDYRQVQKVFYSWDLMGAYKF